MTNDRQFRNGDVTLNYRVTGKGAEPLVCIHGVGASLDAWDSVADDLKDRFTILTFDLRGHGKSAKVRGRYEIDDFVNDTLALAGEVGFDTFHLIGFSLGGLIAQRIALTRLEVIRRLILLSTVAGRNEDERERVMARLEALRSGERGSHYDASVSRWFSEEFQARNPDLMEKLRERNAQNDPECYAAAYRVLAETDFGGLLDQIRCPTLIATGEFDIGSNPRMARYMHASIPGSQLQIFPGLRHSVLMEAPDVIAAMMQRFLLEKETP